jgi:hypothetical protein
MTMSVTLDLETTQTQTNLTLIYLVASLKLFLTQKIPQNYPSILIPCFALLSVSKHKQFGFFLPCLSKQSDSTIQTTKK